MDDRSTLSLYRRHRQELVDYAGRLSGDRGQAEDIVHDAWVRLDQHSRLSAVREPLAYLKRIVRNLSVDMARGRARRNTDGGDAMRQAERTIADDAPSQYAEIAAREEMELVLAAIEAMPDRQKQAMALYHFEGLTIRQVADRIGISRTMAHEIVRDGLRLCALRREGSPKT